MVTTCDEKIMLEKILFSKRELCDINFKRFKKQVYIAVWKQSYADKQPSSSVHCYNMCVL